jgi:hypothetical protein
MEDPGTVVRGFHAWVLEKPTLVPIRFWSKPTTFDFMFLSSYFRRYELPNPFHFRYAKDLNSYLFGRGHTDINEFWKGVEPVGSAHNALHDCIYQIRGLFQA